MRTRLKPLDNLRRIFIGTFERFGRKTNFKGYPTVTVLLMDIKDKDGKIATDHLWLGHTKQFQALGEMREGDIIQFHARVRQYVKGYRGYREDAQMENPPRLDYKLSHPTQFRIIKRGKGEIVPVPDFNARHHIPEGNEAKEAEQGTATLAEHESSQPITIKSADQQTDLKGLMG